MSWHPILLLMSESGSLPVGGIRAQEASSSAAGGALADSEMTP